MDALSLATGSSRRHHVVVMLHRVPVVEQELIEPCVCATSTALVDNNQRGRDGDISR
jgi:hypothetical protein